MPRPAPWLRFLAVSVSVALSGGAGHTASGQDDAVDAADAAVAAEAADESPEMLPDGEVREPITTESNDAVFESSLSAAESPAAAADGPVVSLGEALRVTLMTEPNIRLAQQDLEIARAAVLESRSVFDLTAYGEFRHGRQYNPLPDTQVEAQQEAGRNLELISEEVKRARQGKGDGKVDITETVGGKKRTRTIDISNLSDSGIEIQGSGAPSDVPRESELEILRQIDDQARFLDSQFNTPQTEAMVRSSTANLQDRSLSRADALKLLDESFDEVLSEFTVQRAGMGNQTTYSAGARKLYRSGIFVDPHIDFQRSDLTNNASINLDFTVPLGRSRGAVSERAAEDAALIDLQASQWQLRHEIATSMFNTAVAFWNCLSAQEDYRLLRNSESVARSIFDLTQLQVEAGEMMSSEGAKSQARLSDIVSQRIEAEFALLSARRQLGLAMGLEGVPLLNPPYAAGTLPKAPDIGGLTLSTATPMLEKALMLRDDRRAAYQLARSGKILADAARFDLKPIIDLFFEFGYNSVDEGTQFKRNFSAFSDRKYGLAAFGGLTMEWPMQNNLQKGRYQRNVAIYNQRRISARDLDRNIQSAVSLAVAEIESTRRQLDELARSVGFSRDALQSERRLFTVGETSLLDTIILEDQFTQALRTRNVVNLNHVIAISRLRYETGTILEPTGQFAPEAVQVDVSNLTQVPQWGSIADSPVQPIATSSDNPPQPLFRRFGFGAGVSKPLGDPAPGPGQEYWGEGEAGSAKQTPSATSVSADGAGPAPTATPSPARSTSPSGQSPRDTTPGGEPRRYRPLLDRIFGSSEDE